ncbi:hypothetical protein HGG72_05650 [Ochrobactrum pecoris]|uniref:Uncharacterized protein n=1 Tax=Brucella pecoris TaxID=867683 RepID=A0A5C5CEE0_9HYPH|nr:hypothetical protein [Brucella pecoris]MBB4094109.1 hypothetical protein [Brucella pecoris]NKW79923.1 hypothetical protein [Brucella pecoris]TNV09478.1 hypothetical protein FIB18_20675 [Brucella pecoris]
MLKPEGEKGGRGKTVQKSEGFSHASLAQARFILRHDDQLAQSVINGQLVRRVPKPDTVSLFKSLTVSDFNPSI